MPSGVLQQLERANKELWLILSMCLIALLLNVVVDAQRMMLSFYTVPTLCSAYLYGRRHATLTAFASVLVVALLLLVKPGVPAESSTLLTWDIRWLDLLAWGGILILTGYLMGTLYEHKNAQIQELRQTSGMSH